jgi:hypothetical protein
VLGYEVHEALDDDVDINGDNGILSYFLDDDGVVHDSYWSSFGFSIYDIYRDPSVVLEALDIPHLEVIFSYLSFKIFIFEVEKRVLS